MVHSTSHIGPLWGPGKLIVTVHDLIFMRYPEDYSRGWLAMALLILPRVLKRAKAIIAHFTCYENRYRALLRRSLRQDLTSFIRALTGIFCCGKKAA